jgi:hypothetical protein
MTMPKSYKKPAELPAKKEEEEKKKCLPLLP